MEHILCFSRNFGRMHGSLYNVNITLGVWVCMTFVFKHQVEGLFSVKRTKMDFSLLATLSPILSQNKAAKSQPLFLDESFSDQTGPCVYSDRNGYLISSITLVCPVTCYL